LLTHSLTHSLTPSYTHARAHAHTHTRAHTHTHTRTHTHTHTQHSLTHSLTHSQSFRMVDNNAFRFDDVDATHAHDKRHTTVTWPSQEVRIPLHCIQRRETWADIMSCSRPRDHPTHTHTHTHAHTHTHTHAHTHTHTPQPFSSSPTTDHQVLTSAIRGAPTPTTSIRRGKCLPSR
jgi:hypothetical protein